MAFLYFKLVAKNNCYAILSARLRMYACSAYEPRPHLFVDQYCTAVIIYIWQEQNGDPIACRSSKTPYRYVLSVNHTARRYTQASAWSRALTTAWSHAYCAITLMASNT